jgi:hypothetical protein
MSDKESFKAAMELAEKEELHKGEWGDRIVEDGTIMQIVESEGQMVGVRVGSVFRKDGEAKEPGIWIEFQELYMHSPMHGPLLLSKSTWRELNEYVESALAEEEENDV